MSNYRRQTGSSDSGRGLVVDESAEMMARLRGDSLENLVDYVMTQIANQVSQSWVVNKIRRQYIRSVQDLLGEMTLLLHMVRDHARAANALRPENLARTLRADDADREAAALEAEARRDAVKLQRILYNLQFCIEQARLEEELRILRGGAKDEPDNIEKHWRDRKEDHEKWRIDKTFAHIRDQEEAEMEYDHVEELKRRRQRAIDRIMERCGGVISEEDQHEINNIIDRYNDLIRRAR